MKGFRINPGCVHTILVQAECAPLGGCRQNVVATIISIICESDNSVVCQSLMKSEYVMDQTYEVERELEENQKQ